MKIIKCYILAGLIVLLVSCSPPTNEAPSPKTTPLSTKTFSDEELATNAATPVITLESLAYGCVDGVQKEDLLLVEEGLHSGDPRRQQLAYLAIEKLAYCTSLLDKSFVDAAFPQLINEIVSANEDTSEFATRAVGSLSKHTGLLSQEQTIQAYEVALDNFQSGDFEYRRRGVNLINDLIHDLEGKYRDEAIDLLISTFDAWLQANTLQWQEFIYKLSEESRAEDWFYHQAILAFLWNCQHIQSETQALSAYDLLITTINDQRVSDRALVSVAEVTRLLPLQQRQEAINFVIQAAADERYWYDKGSGVIQPANYASEALLVLVPILSKQDIRNALDAAATQMSNEGYEAVFGETVDALNTRLSEMSE